MFFMQSIHCYLLCSYRLCLIELMLQDRLLRGEMRMVMHMKQGYISSL